MGVISKLLGREAPAPAPERVEPTVAAPAASQPNDMQNPNVWNTAVLGGGRSTAGVRVTEGSAMTLPAVMQALRVLTGVFAMTPLIYYRKSANGGKERATDSPLYALFHDRPNQAHTPFVFKELMMADLVLAGRFAAYVSRSFRQDPTALTRLDPRLVVPARYFDRQSGIDLFFDATLPDGSRERFSRRDVWYVQGFGRDGINGLDPMTFMREALGGALGTQEFANRFWSNGATPPMALSTPKAVPVEAKEQIKKDWHDRVGGLSNAHKVAVLDHDLKPVSLGTDNEKSQFIETRTFQVIDVARALGVPPHLVFELSKATFSNIEHQSLEFVTYHMQPHYSRVAEAATQAFAEPGCFFEFLPEALLKGDIKTRWEAYKAAREAGVLNADEIRERENLNKIGGAAGETYLWPLNFGPAGQAPRGGTSEQ